MKTNQEMVRYIDSFSVVQRTSDGYFDGTELLRQWNNVEGNPRRQMSKFLESDNTSEFLKALAEDESHRAKMLIGENQLLIKVKGRNTKEGKTPDKVWMNPLLFIKFAMWINPAFEVKVLRFVTHSNVMRDIRNILEQLEEKHKFNFELMFKITKLGNNAERKDPYYLLTKKDCLLLASGYDANLRAKIINRWEELEENKRELSRKREKSLLSKI